MEKTIKTFLIILLLIFSLSCFADDGIPNSILKQIIEQEAKIIKKTPRIRFLPVKDITLREKEYLHEFFSKIENSGNIYIKNNKIKVTAKESVIISIKLNSKGKLISVKIIESAMNDSFNKAVLSIINLATPFKEFPQEMREKYDQLNITRSIKYSP